MNHMYTPPTVSVKYMLNKNTLGVKKSARPIRSSIANRYVRPKTLRGQEVT